MDLVISFRVSILIRGRGWERVKMLFCGLQWSLARSWSQHLALAYVNLVSEVYHGIVIYWAVPYKKGHSIVEQIEQLI